MLLSVVHWMFSRKDCTYPALNITIHVDYVSDNIKAVFWDGIPNFIVGLGVVEY